MGYAEYLRRLLEPLRLYDFSVGTAVRAENDAAGGGLDVVAALVDLIYREVQPLSAEREGLALWEQIMPHTPPADTEARRRAIAALMSTTDSSFTPSALERSLAACGLSVGVREVDTQRIEVSFPDVGGIPPDFERITATLDLLLPCHLVTEYRFNYLTWERFEYLFANWTVFDTPPQTWEQFELRWK